jgi:AraC family transcriptional regulator
MLSRDSRSEYEHRIHQVLEHIDRHLGEPLDLTVLAEVAHFSPYHFHRLFAAWMGETLGDYVRRRRVEVGAAYLAAQPRVAVLNVALSVGFGSGEAFTRAFRARFGSAPSAWRAQRARERVQHRNPGQVQRNPGQAADLFARHDRAPHQPHQEPAMNVRIIERQPTRVAYLRHTGPYGEPLGRFWGDTVAPWLATNGWLGQPRYGISHDDPSITDPAQCRYDACVELPQGATPGARQLQTTLPGGRYAVLHFEGRSADIGDAWTRLLRDWLPQSGLQLDARPCFEHYPVNARCDEQAGTFECEICIPVSAL